MSISAFYLPATGLETGVTVVTKAIMHSSKEDNHRKRERREECGKKREQPRIMETLPQYAKIYLCKRDPTIRFVNDQRQK